MISTDGLPWSEVIPQYWGRLDLRYCSGDLFITPPLSRVKSPTISQPLFSQLFLCIPHKSKCVVMLSCVTNVFRGTNVMIIYRFYIRL